MQTDPNGMPILEQTDPASVATFNTAFAQIGTTTNPNGHQIQTFRWANTAARNAQTGMVNGDEGFQVDTGETWKRISGAWKLWDVPLKSFTPTFNGLTLGNGTVDGSYSVSSGLLTLVANFTMGSSSSVTGSLSVSMPVGIPRNTQFVEVGGGTASDSTNFVHPVKVLNRFASNNLLIYAWPEGTPPRYNGRQATGSIPFSWGTGNYLQIQATIQLA